MSELNNFKVWLENTTDYSKATISNTCSRVRRADKILPWFNDEVYLFHLEQTNEFQSLQCSIKSQIRKAVKLYIEYTKTLESRFEPRILSLFSGIGVAEAQLADAGFNVLVANEYDKRRAELYSQLYPETNMINGDITRTDIYKKIIIESKKNDINVLMATPPCQGMSTAGQKLSDDERNRLIIPVIEIVKEILPEYILIENVPLFLKTTIEIDGEDILIPDLIEKELGKIYTIKPYIANTEDYGVPQSRNRAIMLMTKKNNNNKEWLLPKKDETIVTMHDAIGHLPSLDPFVTDVTADELIEIFPKYHERAEQALKISKYHKAPHHVKRQIVAMQHTETGKSAFQNEFYYPRKINGEPVKGYNNTYKRQNWDTPAYTITMDNRKISSQNNVHPGRYEYDDEKGDPVYSDARALTLYEILILMTIPENWNIPKKVSEAFLRRSIGEGVPSLFIKKIFENL